MTNGGNIMAASKTELVKKEFGRMKSDNDHIRSLMEDLYDALLNEMDEITYADDQEEKIEKPEEIPHPPDPPRRQVAQEAVKKRLVVKNGNGGKASELDEVDYIQLYEQRLNAGDLKGAQIALKNAHKLEPESYKINYDLANIYMELGELNHAQIFFDRALSIHDDRYEPWYNLGRISMEKKPPDLMEALIFLKQALKVSPDNEEIIENIDLCREMIEENSVDQAG
jgi:tetratricopeptide (TPR) repeat protein